MHACPHNIAVTSRLAEDSRVLIQLVDEFDGLSQATQALLAPFVLPPPAPGSWQELREGAMGTGAVKVTSVEWHSIATLNGEVKVWYQQRYADTGMDDVKAAGLVVALDNLIWSKLTGLMGREPLSDIGQSNNGGDGKLDIYLVHMGDRGLTSPYVACDNSPVHLLIQQ